MDLRRPEVIGPGFSGWAHFGISFVWGGRASFIGLVVDPTGMLSWLVALVPGRVDGYAANE